MKPATVLVAALLTLAGPLAAQQPTTAPQATTTDPEAGAAAPQATPAPGPFANQRERSSYALGLDIGNRFKAQDVDVDPALVGRGIRDAMTGGTVLLDEAQIQEALNALQKDVMARQQARFQQMSEKNMREGQAYLDANKAKEGVVTLPSGLQYRVVTEGTGPTPKATDTVSVHYRGTLINGTVFDSSYDRGQPVSFPVGGVIKGWSEALQLMKVGSKWQLTIPASLAYGERAPQQIGPNAVLLFDVELLAIEPPKTEAAPAPGASPAPTAAPTAEPKTTP